MPFPTARTSARPRPRCSSASSGLKLTHLRRLRPDRSDRRLGDTGYNGVTTVFGGQLSYPVIRSRQQTLNVYGAFDGLESTITDTTTGARATASYDSLRVLRIGEDYALSDLLFGADHSAINALSVADVAGHAACSVRPRTAMRRRRRDRASRPTSPRSTSKPAARRRCSARGTAPPSRLMGLLTGQWSDDILPPAEQFYLGGSQFHARLLFRPGAGRQGARGHC